MWFLIFSIFCSVLVSILLKVARKQNIQVSQAIATNYIMASGLTILLLKPNWQVLLNQQTPYLILLLLGILLPSIFLVMARAVQTVGIVRSDAAQRLSLLIPLLAAFFIFGEPFDTYKLAGISSGLFAIFALTINTHMPRSKANINKHLTIHKSKKTYGLFILLSVWLGYGVIDVLFKQLAQSDIAFTSSLIMSFVLAGIIMFLSLALSKTPWHLPSLLSGFILGAFNFGNIYFYVRAHQQFPENPALVFAAMNIGVITVGTLAGVFLFKEKITHFTALGLILAFVAIFLLLP